MMRWALTRLLIALVIGLLIYAAGHSGQGAGF